MVGIHRLTIIKLKSIIASIAIALLGALPALAQGAGQLDPGHVWGNPTVSPGRGQPSSVTAILDRALGSTRGAIPERGASGWAIVGPSATAGLPYVSNGTGADPAYQLLTGAAFGPQSAGLFWAGPTSGGAVNPTFRAIVATDLPGGTAAQKGIVQCDNVTIICSGGNVITAVGAAASSIDAGGATSISNGNTNGQSCLFETTSGKVGVQPCGAWSNTRLAKTAGYTTASPDCGDTLALGGSAYYAATFNAPSGYALDCAFLVSNEDTGRAKLLLPQFATSSTSFTIGTGSKAFTTAAGLNFVAGQRYRVYSLANPANWMAGTATYASTTLTLTVDVVGGSGTFTDWQIAPEIYLWPGQQRWVFAQNNVWQLSPPHRWLLPGAGNIYELCWSQNGSDSNDGLGAGSGCLAKIQTALNIIGTQWDGGGYNSCAVGIYTGGTNTISESLSQTGQSVGCYLTFNFRGAVTWSTAGSCLNAGDGSIAILNWNLGFVPTLACNNTNLASTCQFYGHQVVTYDFNGSAQWNPQGANDCLFFADAQGRATFGMTTLVVGDGAVRTGNSILFCSSMCTGLQFSGNIAFSANTTIGVAYVIRNGGYINTTASYTAAVVANPSTPTGNSRLLTNGTAIPGSTTNGVTGGQVCTSVC